MINPVNRRRVMQISMAGAAMAAAGCSKESGLTCATSKTLTTGELAARNGRQYVENSKTPNKSCANCTFFQTIGEGCGTCAIDSLPANPAVFCISWAAKEASLKIKQNNSPNSGGSENV